MKVRNIVILGAILSIILGFTVGKIVVADAPAPGSKEDPLVSKSYADQAIGDRVAELEKQVAELTVKAQALQNTINELQAKINKTPSSSTGTSGTSTTPPAQSNTGTTAPSTGGSVVGKVCYIKSTNNYVNVRSTPSTEANIVTKVYKDEPMGIEEVKDNWYKIKLGDGKTGWVASWVVEIKGQ